MDETTGNKSTGQLHLKSTKRHIRTELLSELIINTAKSQVRVQLAGGGGTSNEKIPGGTLEKIFHNSYVISRDKV